MKVLYNISYYKYCVFLSYLSCGPISPNLLAINWNFKKHILKIVKIPYLYFSL